MKRIIAAIRELAHRFHRRDGNVVIMFSLALAALIPAAGMAIDAIRMYTVKVQLGAALDAAGLAVASSPSLTDAQKQARLNKYFYGNFPTNIGTPTSLNMATDAVNTYAIDLTATAKVQPVIMQLLGFGAVNVAVSAQVTKQPVNIEVAFVLDNTGSMFCGDAGTSNCSQGTPPSHADSLTTITQNMIDTLFQGNTTNSKLKVAIVPYVTSVNVGKALSKLGLLDTYVPKTNGHYQDLSGNTILDPTTGTDIAYDSSQSATGSGWWGCVIEPTSPNEDTAGDGPDISEPAGGWSGLTWVPYYWEPIASYNPWYTTTKRGKTTTNVFYATNPQYDGGPIDTLINTISMGPNLGCATPMTPLTSDYNTLKAAVSNLKAAENSGTISHIGMVWGWRALSPNPPFSDDQPYATAPNPNGFPQNENGWVKVVVLETDGTPNFNGISTCANSDPLTGLGYVCNGKIGTNITKNSTVISHLNSRLSTICSNMAAKNIVIYAIGFGVDSQTNTTLTNCKANGGEFIYAANSADLQSAFDQIANKLNEIRLSR